MASQCIIYGLSDPVTGCVRYVGKTTQPLSVRYQQHLKGKFHCRKTSWIKSLSDKGLKPTMVVIREVPTAEQDENEIEVIAQLREAGADLVNGTAGGDGMRNPSPEVRAKMSASRRRQQPNLKAIEAMRVANVGSVRSEETRRKMSHAKIRLLADPQLRKDISDRLKGHVVTQETRRKLSAKIRGFTHTAEARRKIADAGRGRVRTPESRAKASVSVRRALAAKRAAVGVGEQLALSFSC